MTVHETQDEGRLREDPDPEPDSPERSRLLPGHIWTTVLMVGVVLASLAASAGMAYALGSNHGYHRAVAAFEKALEKAVPAGGTSQNPAMPNPESFPPLPSEPAQRRPGHHFAGRTLDGDNLDLSQTRGQPTLIVFWTHW